MFDQLFTRQAAIVGYQSLSQSLPLRKERFSRNECRGYFGGILPEESKREIIARNLGISARNDYAMLEQIGGECAGDRIHGEFSSARKKAVGAPRRGVSDAFHQYARARLLSCNEAIGRQANW